MLNDGNTTLHRIQTHDTLRTSLFPKYFCLFTSIYGPETLTFLNRRVLRQERGVEDTLPRGSLEIKKTKNTHKKNTIYRISLCRGDFSIKVNSFRVSLTNFCRELHYWIFCSFFYSTSSDFITPSFKLQLNLKFSD